MYLLEIAQPFLVPESQRKTFEAARELVKTATRAIDIDQSQRITQERLTKEIDERQKYANVIFSKFVVNFMHVAILPVVDGRDKMMWFEQIAREVR